MPAKEADSDSSSEEEAEEYSYMDDGAHVCVFVCAWIHMDA